MTEGRKNNPVQPTALILIVLALSASAASSLAFLAHPVSAGSIVAKSGVVGMVLDPGRPRLYLLNDINSSVVVLNTTSDKIITQIFVGSGPSGLDVSQDDSQLYVTIRGTNQLGIIDLSTLTLSKRVDLTFTPWDVAAGPQGRAYVSHLFDFAMSSVDTVNLMEQNSIVASETGGVLRVSPDRRSLYEGYLGITPCIIDKYNVTTDNIQSLSSSPSGSMSGNFGDMAVDPDNVHLYVMCAYPYVAQWLNTTDWTLSGTLPTGPYPRAIGLASSAQLAFTAQGFGDIDAFNTTTRTLLQTYHATGTVTKITALKDGTKFYALTSDGQIQVFNPPTWPSNSKLTATSISITSIGLSWTPADPPATSSYTIVGGPTTALVPAATLSYNITRLSPFTKYNFTIYAEDSSGDLSLTGPSVSVTTLPDTIPPNWPQGSSVTAYNITPISLTLTWTSATDNVGATNYRVYANTTLLTATGNATTLVVSGLKANTTYNFQIQAGDLSSNWSTDGPANTVQTPAQSTLPGPYGIVYVLSFPNRTYLGSKITFVNEFSDTGPSQIKILSISMLSGIGVFSQGNLSLIIQPGNHATLNITTTIPLSTYPTSYYVTTSVVWQYLDPASDTWQNGSPDPIVVNPVITVLRPDLNLKATPPSLTITPGSTGTLTLSLIASNGFTENVALSHQTMPAGFTIVFSPNFVSSTKDSTIIISVDSTVPSGSYDIIISGFGLYLAPTLDILVIVPASTDPDFSITPSTASTSFDSGSPFKTSFTITPTNAFTGLVQLALSSSSNLSCSLDQASIQTSGTIMLSCTGDTLGDYIVTITATSGSISHQATLRAHVAPSPSITTNNASLPLLGITPIFLVELVGAIIALMAIAGLAIIVVSRRRRVTWRTIR